MWPFAKKCPRLDRLEGFEAKIPKVLSRTFNPSSLSWDERVERLELMHVDLIAAFEQNFLVIDLKEGPTRVQVLLSCPSTLSWLVRLPSGELRLVPRTPLENA